jgi:hypothetical protein
MKKRAKPRLSPHVNFVGKKDSHLGFAFGASHNTLKNITEIAC